MKQKIVVRAMVKDRQGRTLLLRRRGGRPSIEGKFELPGGKTIAGEQPIDAMRRTLKYHTGLVSETIQLFDVVTFIDPDDRRMEYVFILFLIGLPPMNKNLTLDGGYDKYIWKKKSEIQQNVVTKSTKILLGLSEKLGYGNGKNPEKFVIYTDGASRGNPGLSAAGFVILDHNEDVIYEGGRFLGVKESSFAEYAAVLLALTKARFIGLNNVEIRSDSLATVNQLNMVNKVNDPTLHIMYDRIQKLTKGFAKIRFIHVRRDFNRLADGVANKILDREEGKQKSYIAVSRV